MKSKNKSAASGKFSLDPEMLLWIAGIVTLTFLVFTPVLRNEFINWDDNATVFENHHLSKPIPEGIRFFFGPNYIIGNYIPLTMITYMLEYHAVALKPYLYHLVNLLIHLINMLLVFWFIYLLSGKKPWVALFVALFFGIHPMHVESVAWVAELKDVLYSLFFIAGLIAYYKSLEIKLRNTNVNEQSPSDKRSARRLLFFSFMLFALSILSKPAAVSFPLVLLLLDFYTGRKFEARTWLEKIPFFLVSLLFGIIAIRAQDADLLLHDDYNYLQRSLFASHSLIVYLVKLFIPAQLSIFYPYPRMLNGHLPFLYYIAPFAVILLFYGIYRTLKHSRLVAFGFLFFFANIVLVLQIISVGDAVMADRYTYISYIGLFFILGMSLDKLSSGGSQRLKSYKGLVKPAVLVVALTFSYLSYARSKVWKNDNTVATDLLDKFPDDWLALNNKGFILYNQARYEDAAALFSKAIRVKPDYTRASINLANVYMSLKDFNNALRTVDTALKYAPKDPNLFNKKGLVLFSEQKYPEAIELFKEALRIKKEDMYSYMNLGQCYYMLKDYEKGVQAMDTALKYNPADYVLLNDKGYFLFLMHKYPEAEYHFKASLGIKPDYKTAEVNLTNCQRAMADSSKVMH